MARKHARYSPSKLSALMLCRKFRRKETTDGSDDEGTMLHKATETRDLTGLSEQQKLEVQMAYGYVDSLYAGDPGQWVVLTEPRLDLDDLTYGHADVVLIHKKQPLVHVIDYKYVRNYYDGKYAKQLQAYGAALLSMIQAGQAAGVPEIPIRDDTDEVRWLVPVQHIRLAELHVVLHVVAPRVTAEPIVEEWLNGNTLLDTVRAEITTLYAELEDPFFPPCPDPDLCSLCAHAATCPALNQVVVHAASGILGLPLPSVFAPGNPAVSARDRALAQVLRGVFDNWGDQVGKLNTEFVKAGGEIPGFKLRSRSNGAKIDTWATHAAMSALRELGYTDEELLAACTLSVSTLSKNKAETSAKTEGEAKEEILRTIGDLATESTSTFLAKVKRTKDPEMVTALLTQGE